MCEEMSSILTQRENYDQTVLWFSNGLQHNDDRLIGHEYWMSILHYGTVARTASLTPVRHFKANKSEGQSGESWEVLDMFDYST